jgi:8-oxo-dGTP pyrophosphatase MutT (NUDIX family)
MRDHEVLVVVRRGAQVLVLERSAARGGYWNLVAGGVESGESPAAAAVRELFEETGLATGVRALPLELSYEGSSGSVRLDAYVADAPIGWEPTLDDEHVAYRWCSASDAVELLPYDEPRTAVREATVAA